MHTWNYPRFILTAAALALYLVACDTKAQDIIVGFTPYCSTERFTEQYNNWIQLSKRVDKTNPLHQKILDNITTLETYHNSAECATHRSVLEQERIRDKLLAEELAEQKLKPGVTIGMTTEEVINNTNWGKPNKVNRTVTSKVTHEQWVYSNNNYLYFTNGKLTAYQH